MSDLFIGQNECQYCAGRVDHIDPENFISNCRKPKSSLPNHCVAKQLQMNTPSPHFSNNKVVVHSPSEANVSDTIDGISFHLESNNNSVLNHHIDIVAILEDLKMDRYIDLFRREEIDLLAFCLLEREDLLEINIPEEDIEPLMQAIVVHSDLLNISPETMLGPLNIT